MGFRKSKKGEFEEGGSGLLGAGDSQRLQTACGIQGPETAMQGGEARERVEKTRDGKVDVTQL